MVTKAEREFNVLGIIGAIKFPVVLRSVHNETVYITIVYHNRSEMFKLTGKYNNTIAKKQESTFNPYSEIEMELGNGARIIRGGDY